ncbi:methyltransferase [bacterium]|nr:methyltransferase [bacterium]MDB2657569.1 methyltransferase [Crocinitomicaceae bacterium]MDB3907853.1 methyltransferase [Crocinitomicaceae bacterium]
MIRKKLKNIWFRLFSKRIVRKIENDRLYQYKSLQIALEPGVFHPKYFDSSQMLLNWVETNEVQGKNLIEVGCGSGITSLRAAQFGAHVWAIDINAQAIELLNKNAGSNGVQLTALESDLFSQVDDTSFDFVLINPPFYPKNPTTDAEKAWFCGSGFEYFHALFDQLKQRGISSGIFMTLSDDCDLDRIQSIAKEYGYSFHLRETKKSFFEKNFLFGIGEK